MSGRIDSRLRALEARQANRQPDECPPFTDEELEFWYDCWKRQDDLTPEESKRFDELNMRQYQYPAKPRKTSAEIDALLATYSG